MIGSSQGVRLPLRNGLKVLDGVFVCGIIELYERKVDWNIIVLTEVIFFELEVKIQLKVSMM